MSVLVEGFSLIVRRSTIESAFPGGISEYKGLVPNKAYCADQNLTRVGFLDWPEVTGFLERLRSVGLTHHCVDGDTDVGVVHQDDGPLAFAPWLEWGRDEAGRSIAWLSGTDAGILAVPAGWSQDSTMGFFDRFRPRVAPASVISELLPAIFVLAKQAAESLTNALEKSAGASLDPYAGSRMLFDLIFFNYQWVDRVAYKTLGPERDSFMDALRIAVMGELADVALLPSLSGAQRKQASEELERKLDEFLKEFGSYNATPATQDGELPGTLFYEIGKRVAQSAGRPRDLFFIAEASLHAMGTVKAMDVPKVLAKLR